MVARTAQWLSTSLLRYVIVFALFVTAWYGLSEMVARPIFMPHPVKVWDAVKTTYASGELIRNATISIKRLGTSYLLAAALGIPLGVVMGLNKYAYAAFRPTIEILRPISGIAWIPMALYMFGVGEVLPRFIIFYTALFPFVINTIEGIVSVDRRLIDSARVLGAPKKMILLEVMMPAALPSIFAGARIAMGLAWMSLIAAELVGTPSGLGFSIEWYRGMLMTPRVMASMAVVGVLGFTMDRIIRMLGEKFTPWTQS